MREGHLAGAWQTASPRGFPCWRLAGHGDLLSAQGHAGPVLTVVLRGFLPGFLTLDLRELLSELQHSPGFQKVFVTPI